MRILIAEDQLTAALFLRRLLQRMGNEVTVTSNGEEAWKVLQEDNVPLLISDWMMPRMDGLELCHRIRSSSREFYTYVILLTARDCHVDRLAGLRAGADDFLVKPPDPDELAVRLEIAARILGVHEKLREQNSRLAELATIDELTQVKNRRRFREDFDMHAALAAREDMPLSLVMADVDHFKTYNDTFGHPAGDEVLRTVAQSLRENVRLQDVVARYGGEEFTILLPSTRAVPAIEAAERLRFALEQTPMTAGRVTASFGVATVEAGDRDVGDMLEKADKALYFAKRSGRNRVCHFDDSRTGRACP